MFTNTLQILKYNINIFYKKTKTKWRKVIQNDVSDNIFQSILYLKNL